MDKIYEVGIDLKGQAMYVMWDFFVWTIHLGRISLYILQDKLVGDDL